MPESPPLMGVCCPSVGFELLPTGARMGVHTDRKHLYREITEEE
jgi:hypothetical protein